tara:strand:+ start:164 stop:598 length:435 start_codon:yes stop_codon:yes gene_type:complete
MSGSKSRNKGRGYEYEIANELFQQLGINFVRELDQTREKHLGDLRTEDCNFPFVIECKRYKSGVSGDWWDQVCTAASIADKMPMLFYRLDRQKTRVRMPVASLVGLAGYLPNQDIAEQYDWRYAVETDLDTAMMIIRETLANGA